MDRELCRLAVINASSKARVFKEQGSRVLYSVVDQYYDVYDANGFVVNTMVAVHTRFEHHGMKFIIERVYDKDVKEISTYLIGAFEKIPDKVKTVDKYVEEKIREEKRRIGNND